MNMKIKRLLAFLTIVTLLICAVPISAFALDYSDGNGYDQDGHLIMMLAPFEKITAFGIAASTYSENPIKITVPKDGYYNLRIKVSSKFQYVSHPEHSLSVLVNETEEIVHKREKEYYGYYSLQKDANGRFQETFSYGYNFSSGYTYTFTPYLLISGSTTDINWYACEIWLESKEQFTTENVHNPPNILCADAAKPGTYIYQDGIVPHLYKNVLLLDEANKKANFPTPNGTLSFSYTNYQTSHSGGLLKDLPCTTFTDSSGNRVSVTSLFNCVTANIDYADGTKKSLTYWKFFGSGSDADTVTQDTHGSASDSTGKKNTGSTEKRKLYVKQQDGTVKEVEDTQLLDEANKTVTIVTNEGSNTYNYNDYYYDNSTNTTMVYTDNSRYEITSYDDHSTVTEYNISGNTFIYNYYYTSDGGGSSSDPGGGTSSGGGSGEEEEDKPFDWGWLWDILGNVVNFILGAVGNLLKLLGNALNSILGLFDFVGNFMTAIGEALSFLPPELWALITAGVVAAIALRFLGR